MRSGRLTRLAVAFAGGDLHPVTEDARAIEEAMLALVRERAPKTVCPSEVARALSEGDWRALMPAVREGVVRLWSSRAIEVTQRGAPVDPRRAKGAIRLSLAYRIGRGEEGVFAFEPYKSELLPLWKFATPALARASSKAIYARFVAYGRAGDFAGMDMARKFLQMGMTRATRYARHAGGRKYENGTRVERPRAHDAEKAASAEIFRAAWERARANRTYAKLKRAFQISRA